MDIIQSEKGMEFTNLIFFKAEVSSPNDMKKKFDILIKRMNKFKLKHECRVITKVHSHDEYKKTMFMSMHLCLTKPDELSILRFLDRFPDYEYEDAFKLNKGKYISVSRDMREFQKAIELFIEDSTPEGEQPLSIKEYVKYNRIIEIATITRNGDVIKFDLYKED